MREYDDLLAQGPRIKIMVGEFGSGKTELAVNYALQLKQAGFKTAIVDIDLVKPYFRTRESRALLEEHGVFVVAPEKRFTHADLPVLPQDLTRVLYQTDCQVIMDAGGGESSIALGQLHVKLAENDYQAMLVVNTRRPFTNTPDAIAETLARIESASRLKISCMVSNTNLGAETSEQHIRDGLAIVEKAAALLDIPVGWVVVPEWLAGKVTVNYPVFILKPYTQYPWMD